MYQCIDHLYYIVTELAGLWRTTYVRCSECDYEVILSRRNRWRRE